MLKKFILSTTVLALTTSAFACGHTATFTSNKKPLVVAQNQKFDIQLQSNPSTGFAWKLTSYEKPLVTFVGQKYIAPKNKKLMGAPGVESFTFEANKGNYRVNQVGHIVLTYARPWTKDGTTKKTFIVVVKANHK